MHNSRLFVSMCYDDMFQLTHVVLDKELKHCRHHEDLEVNENVKFKAKEFVKKYMSKTGAVYKREKEDKQEKSPLVSQTFLVSQTPLVSQTFQARKV